jgi:hypothetical protein
MRAYVHGLLGPAGRKNGWQLAEYAGHSTPDELQHLLNRVRWDAVEVRDAAALPSTPRRSDAPPRRPSTGDVSA